MKFTPASIPEVLIIEPASRVDDRGSFMRIFCEQELSQQGVDFSIKQVNRSLTTHQGTIRGMHFQTGDAAEGKIIQCLNGGVYDVAVDLRPESPMYKRWVSVELTEHNQRLVYIPKGFAHGFQTLTDDAELLYFMSAFYVPEDARGIRWNDPQLDIAWPLPNPTLNERDQQWPLM